MPPFLQGPAAQIYIDVQSLTGCIATFLLGLVCGLAYIESRRLLAPRLAHVIAGMALVFLGKIIPFTYTE